ncbi:MAG TPA: OmpA family protein [Prolixibacteraceae bacterium]|nr:OmpA family protein [Prolixibacteraceae bacterium]
MKKLLIVSVLSLLYLSIYSQNVDKKWAIGVGGGYYHNLVASGADGLLGEAYLSRYLSSSFDLMANMNLGYKFASFSDDKVNADIGNLFLNLRYKFYNGKILPADNKIQPYLFAGPGFLSDNKSSGLNFDAGVGAKLMLSKSWSLFAEAGYIHGIDGLRANNLGVDEPCHDNFIKALIGIEWAFSPKLDSDKDGVANHKDKCPNTPKKYKVDKKTGCPVDSDGDGVFDEDDKCPKEKGLAALEGCPDKDGDGIIDKDDDCPDVKGIAEFKGCPDTDGDGIMDSKDDCPKDKGLKEFKGCPDTDGDGIADKEDKCPAVAGLKKFDGCPDTDGDGVADNVDACPDTPAGDEVDDKGCPKEEDMDKWLKNNKVNSIFFGTNENEITQDSKGRMDKLIKLMNSNPRAKVKASGFADPRGNADANMQLSVRRANAAKQYLVSKGIATNRISTEGLGEENSDKESQLSTEELQNSRRVDFTLHK